MSGVVGGVEVGHARLSVSSGHESLGTVLAQVGSTVVIPDTVVDLGGGSGTLAGVVTHMLDVLALGAPSGGVAGVEASGIKSGGSASESGLVLALALGARGSGSIAVPAVSTEGGVTVHLGGVADGHKGEDDADLEFHFDYKKLYPSLLY
jgi:hypothetical protein